MFLNRNVDLTEKKKHKIFRKPPNVCAKKNRCQKVIKT